MNIVLQRKAALLLSATLTVMAGATIAPALPEIAKAYSDAARAELLVGLVLTAPAFAIVLAAPVWGRLSDSFGRRRFLYPAIALYAVAGAAGLVIDGLLSLIASRLLLGVAVSAVMTTSTALMADYFEGEERASLLSLQAAFTGFGGFVFLLLGGWLAEVSWRGPFAVYLLGLPVLALTWAAFGNQEARPHPSDPSRATSRLTREALLFAALAGLQSFLFYTIPVRIPFLADALGADGPGSIGTIIAACVLTSATTSFVLGMRRLLVALWTMLSAGFIALGVGLVIVGLAPSIPSMVLGLIISGFGMGVLLPSLMTAALGSAPADQRGRVSGAMTAAIFLGQFVSPIATTPTANALGDRACFMAAGAVAILAALALAFRGQSSKLEAPQ